MRHVFLTIGRVNYEGAGFSSSWIARSFLGATLDRQNPLPWKNLDYLAGVAGGSRRRAPRQSWLFGARRGAALWGFITGSFPLALTKATGMQKGEAPARYDFRVSLRKPAATLPGRS